MSNVGLANVGNTCFLNSVLQALCISKPIITSFLTDKNERREIPVRDESKKIRLLIAFQQLLHDMKNAGKDSAIVPSAFVKSLAQTVQVCDDDWYVPRQQADSAECLQYILDGLHDAIYRKIKINILGRASNNEEKSHVKAMESWAAFFTKEYSPIVEHLYGQTCTTVQCQACKSVSERYEPWSMLKLPIPGGDVKGSTVPTMIDCLNDSLNSTETIEEYQCDHCKKKQTATLSTKISKLPTMLIVTLKRFTNTGAKIRGKIEWDVENLNLGPWFAFSRCPYTNTRRNNFEYQTYAVIEHMGSSRGGHYHMFARDSDSGWTEYDDAGIRKNVPLTEVVSADSYILFLTRRT
jgi:ubiquitin carboxyl-terminal hydrolase 8